MSRKLALKMLKSSDLSFFQTYLERFPQARQKAFNRGQKVVEAGFFPSLAAQIEAAPDKRAAVTLTCFGPGGAGRQLLMRKLLRQQKNWRLNGETIRNPDELPGRYDGPAPDDVASMGFTGTSAPRR